jgi:DNA modification methylase
MANSEIIGAEQDTARRAPKINTITCGDCLEVMKMISGGSVDLIITDPPYEITDMTSYFTEMIRCLSPTGSIYIFGNKNVVAEYWFSQLDITKKELLCWHYKNSPKPRGRWRMSMQAIIYGYRKDSVFNQDCVRREYREATKKLNGRMRPSSGRMDIAKKYDTSKGALPLDVIERPALTGHLSKERVGHPDQKPLSIVSDLLLASSNKGQLVLDCFSGSGSVALACAIHSRNYIGIEKEEKYCRIAEERIHALRSPAQNAMEICHTAPNSGRDAIPLTNLDDILS